MPSGPGVIANALIAEVVATVPTPVATFLLTSLCDADSVAEQHAVCNTSTLQFVDFVEPTELAKLRRWLPHVKLVQVIHVMGKESVEEAKRIAEFVDAIFLDSGNPTLQIKEFGGTGRTHDWQLSRLIREQVNRPVFLAGGLRASNVVEAIKTVEPFGLDLCWSVRRGGNLDAERLSSNVMCNKLFAVPSYGTINS